MPRRDPWKVARSKEATSPRAGDILLNTAPSPWAPRRYTNLRAAKDELISCKSHDRSILLMVWAPAWNPSSKSGLGRRNSPLERHHQKAWQPGEASCRWDSGSPSAVCKSEEENTEHFPLSFSLPGSLLAFHNFKTDLHFERTLHPKGD